MKTCNPSGMGWEQFTPEGSELAQLKVSSALSVRERLIALDDLCELSRRMMENRKRSGLPYFDPSTGELVSVI
ncbi:MAG: hypothetical protein WEB60_04915 [Terrimicrobiaceae bacterium]